MTFPNDNEQLLLTLFMFAHELALTGTNVMSVTMSMTMSVNANIGMSMGMSMNTNMTYRISSF